jgi:hypothetical protein
VALQVASSLALFGAPLTGTYATAIAATIVEKDKSFNLFATFFVLFIN